MLVKFRLSWIHRGSYRRYNNAWSKRFRLYASLIGAALNVHEIEIWTDVNGILTADPRIVSSAATVPHFSYEEAAALSYFGAKVLHPKTVRPAAESSFQFAY